MSRERGGARVRLTGELDLAGVPILEARIAELRRNGISRVILDLGGLAFMDSTGLRFILELDAEARQDGLSLALVPGSPRVQRVFAITGTESRLPFIG